MNIRLWLLAALVAPGALLAQPNAFGLDDYSGEELYQRFCSACHGASARGDGPVARSLTVAVPDLTQLVRRYGNEFPADELAEIIDGRNLVIAHGSRTMPVWGYEFWWEDGADAEAEATARATINRLLEYLRSIQEP
jgi:mono/diheme cytochrome c family protein